MNNFFTPLPVGFLDDFFWLIYPWDLIHLLNYGFFAPLLVRPGDSFAPWLFRPWLVRFLARLPLGFFALWLIRHISQPYSEQARGEPAKGRKSQTLIRLPSGLFATASWTIRATGKKRMSQQVTLYCS